MVAGTTFCSGQSDTTTSPIFVSDVFGFSTEDSAHHFNQFQSSISDFQELDIREAPGTVLIITAEQIQAMGSKDLMEVLAFLPSVSLGRDVDDVIGLGIRGLWAHEGKVLFMLNGIPLNDLDFGTFALGNRLSLENVSRIEVMTGPGSALYGGTAALGVINIITKTGLESKGMKFSVESSLSNGIFNRNTVSLSFNDQVGKDTYLSVQASLRGAVKSTYSLMDADTVSLNYADSTRVTNQNFYIGISKKNLKTQFLFDDYSFQLSDENYSILMKNLAWDNEWKYEVSKRFQGKTKAAFLYQLPWFNLNNIESDLIATNTTERKIMLSSILDGKLNDKFNLNFGVQAYHQKGVILHRGYSWAMSESPEMYVRDLAIHSELNFRSAAGIFKIGIRGEKNTLAPLLFAPRFAWNLVKGNFFSKILVSTAFKIPTIQNVNLGPSDDNLKNEIVQTNELTIGYQAGNNATAQLTIFQTSIRNPIVYVVDTLFYDNYINRNLCGSHGLELRYFFKSTKAQFQGGLSLYRPNPNTDMPEIIGSESDGKAYLAFSAFKTSFSGRYNLSESITLYTAANYQSKFESSHDMGEGVIESEMYSPMIIVNAGIIIRPLKWPNLICQAGVNNILDNPYIVASPYVGDLQDLPLLARQFSISFTYRLK